METFRPPRLFADHHNYAGEKRTSLSCLTDHMIDRPILSLVRQLNGLPFCFTLQCCWEHFLYEGQGDPNYLGPLPRLRYGTSVTYRLAYVALCLEPTDDGHRLYDGLSRLASQDDRYIQFGSADWFWEQHVNSYAIQVMPARFACEDTAALEYDEALEVELARGEMFQALEIDLQVFRKFGRIQGGKKF